MAELHVAGARESEVRVYSRTLKATFAKARGLELFDDAGRRWIDFFCGAGALNLGHNHPHLLDRLQEYLADGGVIHALDADTVAKRQFLEAFGRVVLDPRSLDHRIQFTGPSGADAVEAALKLAQKVTGRRRFYALTGSFHGTTSAASAVSEARRGRVVGEV